MLNIIVATNNTAKIAEIARCFEEVAPDSQPLFTILPLSAVLPNFDLEAHENGTTFEENATKKALAVYEATRRGGLWPPENGGDIIIIADDSGLEIDALGGAPGVDSANFMGRDTPYIVRFEHILRAIEGRDRKACFVCVMALVQGGGAVRTFRATIEGEIAHAPMGDTGFGYDPIFYVPEHGCTTAQMGMAQKNKISHRGKALRMVANEIFGI